MKDKDNPGLVVLNSGIFPDAGTVEQAVERIDGYRVVREELYPAAMSAGDWDRVLARILKSEKVVTV